MNHHTAKPARLRSTTRPEATQPHPVDSNPSLAAQQYVTAHLGSSSIVRIDPESVAPPRYRVHTEGIEKQPALKTAVVHDHIQCLRTEGKYVYFSQESFHLLFVHIMTPLLRHCQARSYPLTENREASAEGTSDAIRHGQDHRLDRNFQQRNCTPPLGGFRRGKDDSDRNLLCGNNEFEWGKHSPGTHTLRPDPSWLQRVIGRASFGQFTVRRHGRGPIRRPRTPHGRPD